MIAQAVAEGRLRATTDPRTAIGASELVWHDGLSGTPLMLPLVQGPRAGPGWRRDAEILPSYYCSCAPPAPLRGCQSKLILRRPVREHASGDARGGVQ